MKQLRCVLLTILICLCALSLAACGNPSGSVVPNAGHGPKERPQSDPYFSEHTDHYGVHRANWTITIDNGPLAGETRSISVTETDPDGRVFKVENTWDEEWRLTHQSFYRYDTLYMEYDICYLPDEQLSLTITRHETPVNLYVYSDNYLINPLPYNTSYSPQIVNDRYASEISRKLSFEPSVTYTGSYTLSQDNISGHGFIRTVEQVNEDGSRLSFRGQRKYGLPDLTEYHSPMTEQGFCSEYYNFRYDDMGMPSSFTLVLDETETHSLDTHIDLLYDGDYQLVSTVTKHDQGYIVTDTYKDGLLLESVVRKKGYSYDEYRTVWEYDAAGTPLTETRYAQPTVSEDKQLQLQLFSKLNENGFPVEEHWHDMFYGGETYYCINTYYESGAIHTKQKFSPKGNLYHTTEYAEDGSLLGETQHWND